MHRLGEQFQHVFWLTCLQMFKICEANCNLWKADFCIRLISLRNISLKYDIWFWFFKTTSETKCYVLSPNAINIFCVLVVTISKSFISNTKKCKYVTKQVANLGIDHTFSVRVISPKRGKIDSKKLEWQTIRYYNGF